MRRHPPGAYKYSSAVVTTLVSTWVNSASVKMKAIKTLLALILVSFAIVCCPSILSEWFTNTVHTLQAIPAPLDANDKGLAVIAPADDAAAAPPYASSP